MEFLINGTIDIPLLKKNLNSTNTKYNNNNTVKNIHRGLHQTVPPWYSPAMPKPLYENENATAMWDVPLYVENTEVRANRIDARIVDKNAKEVIVIEMSCPWLEIAS